MAKRRFKSNEEVEFIRLNYENMELSEIMKVMNRSRSFVLNIVNDLGMVKKPMWTKREDEYLIKNYNIKSIEEIAIDMNRSYNAIMCRSGVLGIRNKSKAKEWNDKDIETLVKLYGHIDSKELASMLDRDVISIRNKATKLRIVGKCGVPWSEDEISLLVKIYKHSTQEELQDTFPNRDYKSIVSKASSLGVKKDRCHNWSKKEIEFLRQSSEKTISEMANELNLPQGVVYVKVKSLNLPYIKAKGLSVGDRCKCIVCNNIKEYNEDNFNLNMTTLTCRACNKKLINIRKYKDKYNIVLDVDLMFDTFSAEEWVKMLVSRKIARLPKEILDSKNKMLKCLKYFIKEYLKIEKREDLLTNFETSYKGITMLGNYAFKHYDSVNDLIIDIYKEYDIKQWEFKVTKRGYFDEKKNVKEYIAWFIKEKLGVNIDNSFEYSKYFTDNALVNLGYSRIVHIKKKHKYKNYYFMLKDLFGDVINQDSFSMCKARDGVLLDSNEELIVYEYIKYNINNNIKAIGRSRRNMYEHNGEKYAPDFEIDCIVKGNKIVIEYFGLYYEKTYNSDILKNYKEKADRKMEYFNSMNNIRFVSLFPHDLKNDCKGVREKLTSFLYTKKESEIIGQET